MNSLLDAKELIYAGEEIISICGENVNVQQFSHTKRDWYLAHLVFSRVSIMFGTGAVVSTCFTFLRLLYGPCGQECTDQIVLDHRQCV